MVCPQCSELSVIVSLYYGKALVGNTMFDMLAIFLRDKMFRSLTLKSKTKLQNLAFHQVFLGFSLGGGCEVHLCTTRGSSFEQWRT